jgi:hypothetical protein
MVKDLSAPSAMTVKVKTVTVTVTAIAMVVATIVLEIVDHVATMSVMKLIPRFLRTTY